MSTVYIGRCGSGRSRCKGIPEGIRGRWVIAEDDGDFIDRDRAPDPIEWEIKRLTGAYEVRMIGNAGRTRCPECGKEVVLTKWEALKS